MPKLMIAQAAPNASDPVARIGGVPVAPLDFVWPRCAECHGPMQFLAQIPVAETPIEALQNRDQLLLLFQCQNQPGVCDDWDAESGANAAILVPIGGLTPATPPTLTEEEQAKGLEGDTTLPDVQGITLEDYHDARQEDTPDDEYCDAVDDDARAVVGKLGGHPLWIQGDETPDCACGHAMTFVAQIESFAGGGINFGDEGAGYAFACERCNDQARFLWQCS